MLGGRTQVMTPPLKSLNTRVKSLEEELHALKEQVQNQQAVSQTADSSTEAGDSVVDGAMHPVASQPPQACQLQTEPVANGEAHTGVVAGSELVQAAGPSSQPIPTDCVHDGLPGSSVTLSRQQGEGGRMQLASWRASNGGRSRLSVHADLTGHGVDSDADTPDSCGGRHSKALLSQNIGSYVFGERLSGKQMALQRKGLAPISPLRIPYSASHSVATAAHPVTGKPTVNGSGSRKDALHSLLLPPSSSAMSLARAPTPHTPTGSGLQNGDDNAVSDAAQLSVSWPTDTDASMNGLRGMLVGASLLVNLLVAQACV